MFIRGRRYNIFVHLSQAAEVDTCKVNVRAVICFNILETKYSNLWLSNINTADSIKIKYNQFNIYILKYV